ncbi:MFS transporter [Lysobacter korlensis]|uniref:MFS transporter n=1 Tax=Lysobacter korlensis TaxID=553636 RepID=A0ABV6RX30_9GAMM
MPKPAPEPGRGSFGLLWISQALSQLGTSISTLAYPLLILDATGSALNAGILAAVSAAVSLTAKLPAGLIADRWRYRSLMLVGDAARAFLLATIATAVLFGFATLPLLIVLVAAEVALGAVFGPAEFALLRLLVPAERRAIAVGQMQSRSQLAGLLGPLVGGVLYAVHPALPFALDAASYLASFVLVLGVRSPQRGATARGGEASLRERLGAGWAWLRRDRFLFAAGFWVAALTSVFAAVGLAILVFARDRGANPAELGAMYAISTAGGLVGALLTPWLQRRLSPVAILRSAALVDTAATLVLLPLESPYAIGAAGAAAFFLAPAVSATLFGELSRRCPDELVTRAQSALALVVGAFAPLAPAAIGAVIDGFSPTAAVGVCAAAFAVLLVLALVVPALRATAPGDPPS